MIKILRGLGVIYGWIVFGIVGVATVPYSLYVIGVLVLLLLAYALGDMFE